ncbi:uncharacterized protein LOC143292484 [Babylonia areolata]|uniref:uncharacterized protein LOC143292484 n=1 Tax=Babylonia areolata TaxID=304850 RepID=UPI003FD4BA9D
MADNAEDKDVAMEEGGEMDEDELLGTEGKNGEGQEEAMKDESSAADGEKQDTEEKTEEEKKEEEEEEEEELDDGGAASDVEFTTEDDRVAPRDEVTWKWHIELYPLAPEDTMLDNFVKMVSTADSSHVIYRDNERGEKRGEAHFYAQDMDVARTLMRTICCRKFTFFRPFIYLYHLKEGTEDQYETAYLRLDLIESAKMRWDKQKKNKGDATTRVAKVSDVPLDTSKEFLKVLFARAFNVKRESDQSEEEAMKPKEANEKDEAKEESSSGDKTEEKDEEEENEDQEEELVGEFNGNLTIDCSSRASLRGFLLGYRKVIIDSSLLVIKPLAEDIDIDNLRKEVRKKRCYEAIHGKEWKPVTAADRVSKREEDFDDRGRGGDRGGRGRGGRGDHRGGGDRGGRGGRGGVMTGRQKMNEKSMKRWGGGRDDRRRGGGGGGPGFADDVRYLQTQLAMNTYELQRQIASLRGRDRGFYDMPPMGGGGYGGGYGRDDWGGGYGGGQGSRYGGGGGGGGGGRGGGRKQHRGGWR